MRKLCAEGLISSLIMNLQKRATFRRRRFVGKQRFCKFNANHMEQPTLMVCRDGLCQVSEKARRDYSERKNRYSKSDSNKCQKPAVHPTALKVKIANAGRTGFLEKNGSEDGL